MNFKECMQECHRTAVEHGWWETGERNFGEMVALMHSELSEALEEFRNGRKFGEIYTTTTPHGEKPEGIATELADVLIRLFDTCEALGIPLEEALRMKMEYNEKRPYRHGGKAA